MTDIEPTPPDADNPDGTRGEAAYQQVVAALAAQAAVNDAKLKKQNGRLVVALLVVALLGLAGMGILTAQNNAERDRDREAAAVDRQRYLRRIDEQSRQIEALADSVNQRPAVFDYTRCAVAYIITLVDAGGDGSTPEVVAARAALDKAGLTDIDSGDTVNCSP